MRTPSGAPRAVLATILCLSVGGFVAGCDSAPKRLDPMGSAGPMPSSGPADGGNVLTHTTPFELPPGFPNSPENSVGEEFAPTPYTARQIMQACPTGRVNTFAMAMEAGNFVMVHRFIETSDQGATIQQLFGEVRGDNVTAAPPDLRSQEIVQTWAELQLHSAYPRELTRITSDRVTVGAGSYDCWRYDVIEDGSLTRHWFAKSLAGPPVKMEAYVDGKLLAATELTEIKLR